MYVKGSIPALQCNSLDYVNRLVKVLASVINNCTMPSATTVFRMLSTRCQWETVPKKQLMISRSPEKLKMNIASYLTKDTLKPSRVDC